MVEMGLILPLFLVLVFAIFEYGYMMFKNVSITNATREGARKASMNVYSTQQIKDFVKSNAIGVALTDSEICVSTLAADSAFPNSPPSVTVRVIHSHFWITGNLLRINTLKLKGSQRAVVVTYAGRETVTFTGETCP